MLFTVITATHNNQTTIDRAINSVYTQDFDSWQMIVVDDGSQDGTSNKIHQWTQKDRRIKAIRQNQQGVSYARNHALDAAIGDFVLFLDADDWFEEHCLKQLAELVTLENPDLLIFNFSGVDDANEKRHSDAFSTEQKFSSVSELTMLRRYCATQYGEQWNEWYGNLHNVWGRCYRRMVIDRYRIRFDGRMSIGEDWKFNLQVLPSVTSILIKNLYLYNYYDNQDSVMHVQYWKGHREFFKVFDLIAELLSKSEEGRSYLPYVALDQLRDEFRLIVKSNMSMVKQIGGIQHVIRLNQCQNVVRQVEINRLDAHFKVIVRAISRKNGFIIWSVYSFQERIKPWLKKILKR